MDIMSPSHRHRGFHVILFLLLSALMHFALSTDDLEPRKPLHKVIIIADPGVDDAAAILMAVAHPDVDVLAVISNFGVVSSAEAADNARIILNVVAAASSFADDITRLTDPSSAGSVKKRKNVPVHIGSDFAYGTLPVPNKGGPKGRDFHGLGGLGAFSTHSSMVSINYTTHLSEPRSCEKSALHVDCINYSPVPSPTSPSSTHSTQASVEVEVEAGVGASTQYTACRDVDRSVSGVEFLIAACKAHPGEVSILILSPATTLATAVSAFPSLPNYVKRVYVMGGALRVPGNVSPLAEFNFANDASAASSVIVAFSKKITVIPLDATMQCLLSKNDLEELSRNSGVVGHWFANSVAPFYMQAYRSHNGVDMPLHDAHTVGALIQPDLYAGHTISLEVQVIVSSDATVNGMLLEDRRAVYNKDNNTQDNTDPLSKSSSSGDAESTVQGPKSTGIVDVVLGIDQDGFKKLFIDLLSSLP